VTLTLDRGPSLLFVIAAAGWRVYSTDGIRKVLEVERLKMRRSVVERGARSGN
jgi:hypothetical protein